MSNGCSYSYCKKLESWLVINSRDPITRYGISTTPSPQNYRNILTYPLGLLQNSSGSGHARHFSADLSATNWQSSARLSFIENQIKICESINSPLELQHWYSMLGSHLAANGTEPRIRILLDDLLGSTSHKKNKILVSFSFLFISFRQNISLIYSFGNFTECGQTYIIG